MEIGLIIKKIRNNKGITQQSLADALEMSRPYIARIEAGKNIISSEKLTNILDYCNVNYDEFFFMKNDYCLSTKMSTFKQVYKLNDSKKINELSIFKDEINRIYQESGDIFYKHLYILCHCIESDFNILNIKKGYIDELADYLLSVDEWCYFELVLFNNFLFIFEPTTALLISENLIKRAIQYKDLKTDSKILSFLLFNLLSISLKIGDIENSKQILNTAKRYFDESTNFFEQTLMLYYEGFIEIKMNQTREGNKKCNDALSIFRILGHNNFYNSYKNDMDNILKDLNLFIP